MLGYAFMGKAHSRALLALRHLDVPLRPELVSISGRNARAVEEARARWGWAEATTDWREQVADERIGLFVNGGPNAVHAEPTLAAARAGKHVLCEKPLGLSAAESHELWQEAERAGVVHLCGFNYRFVPAVRLARELLEAGELGEVVHFRARYLQSWGWDADPALWRFDRAEAGTGALGDLGTHVHELAHLLEAIAGEHEVAPHGATFEDGYRCSEVVEAVLGSAESGRREQVSYRT